MARDSQRAVDLLSRSFPQQSGAAGAIVFRAKYGALDDPVSRRRVVETLAAISRMPHVRAVDSPFTRGSGRLSPDRRIGFADVTFDASVNAVSKPAVRSVVDRARAANGPVLQVEANGAVIDAAIQDYGISFSELVGVIAAAIVLLASPSGCSATRSQSRTSAHPTAAPEQRGIKTEWSASSTAASRS